MAARKYVDCRESASVSNCSVKISGTEDEVLETTVLHAISAHQEKDSDELRKYIRSMMKDDLEPFTRQEKAASRPSA